MENYVIYEELAASNPVCLHYKGRKRGSISFISIEKYDKAEEEQATNAVHLCHNLRHNNVRGFLEWYETPKHIWIITELCSGGSLNDVLEQDGCLPEPVVWDFLHQLASGLCYLHSSGVLYCDLRPVKILVDSEGTLKYADFTQARLLGVSKSTDQDEGPNGAPGISTNDNRPNVCLDESVPEMRPHTPGAFLSPVAQAEESTSRDIPDPYLPPECAIGGGPTVAGDLWGLGCLLHHLYCGMYPARAYLYTYTTQWVFLRGK
jgi:serine/threonine-protein kinase ULK4